MFRARTARVTAYEAVVEWDEDGAWIARVPSVHGCHTFGRTLEQVRKRIPEALELWVKDVEQLSFEITLSPEVRQCIDELHALRDQAERVRQEAQASLIVAARTLTKEAGLSLRDAAELLGLSHQRLAQVLGSRR